MTYDTNINWRKPDGALPTARVDIGHDTVVIDFAAYSYVKVNYRGTEDEERLHYSRTAFSLSGKITGIEASSSDQTIYIAVFDNNYMFTTKGEKLPASIPASDTVRSNGLKAIAYIRAYNDGHCEIFLDIGGDSHSSLGDKTDQHYIMGLADGGDYRSYGQDFGPFSEWMPISIE